MLAVGSEPEGTGDWFTLEGGNLLTPEAAGGMLHLDFVPCARVDLHVEGRTLFYNSGDHPQHPDQRRLARMSRLEVRDQKGAVLWSRKGLRSKHHVLPLLAGTYTARLEIGDLLETEELFTVKTGERATVTLSAAIEGEEDNR